MARLPGFEGVHPPRPELTDEAVAGDAAVLAVGALNLDEFYWTGEEVAVRVLQMQGLLMQGRRLNARLIRELHGQHGGWKCGDFEPHLEAIGPKIEQEVLESAVQRWRERYEIPG